MDLRKFSSSSRADVFEACVSKLSTGFLQDLTVCSREAEQRAMLKEDLVEQEKQGRYYNRTQRKWQKKNCMAVVSRRSESFLKYYEEKTGQCRCATCGNVFLWRVCPKAWEHLSGGIASPSEAYAPLRQDKYPSKHARPTYAQSWYYFNGKPIDCSLCTLVGCVDCPRVFPWGEQFRRALCPCGGAVEARPRSKPEPPEAIHIVPRISEFVHHRARLPIPQHVRPVFERFFERRCCCCGYVDQLEGLVYLSYDDPGEFHIDKAYVKRYQHEQHTLGGHVSKFRSWPSRGLP